MSIPSTSLLDYASKIFQLKSAEQDPSTSDELDDAHIIRPEGSIPPGVFASLDDMVDTMVTAYGRIAVIDIDADEYLEALRSPNDQAGTSAAAAQGDTIKKLAVCKKPTFIVDRHYRILCCFLPGALAKATQDDLTSAAREFKDVLRTRAFQPHWCLSCHAKDWRLNAKHFAKYSSGNVPCGTIPISPTSFTRKTNKVDHAHFGHACGPESKEPVVLEPAYKYESTQEPCPSPGFVRWKEVMDKFKDVHSPTLGPAETPAERFEMMCHLANIMLHFSHHDLYLAAHTAREELFPSLAPSLNAWGTVCTSATLTSNMTQSAMYRPPEGTYCEIIMHAGSWKTKIDLPEMNLQLSYDAGAVVVLFGGMWKRQVQAYGELVEWVFSVEQPVLDHAGVDLPVWSIFPVDFDAMSEGEGM